MLVRRTLEVPIPESIPVDALDMELLTATFQALVALRCEKGAAWRDLALRLKEDGWAVQWDLTWRARAKRGEDYEEATGATLEEALSGVTQLARCDMAGRGP